MVLVRFPDPRRAPDDIVAVGGAAHPEVLLQAYRQGIFPWPVEGYPLLWFCPKARAVLEFKDLHVPRRLERERKAARLRFTLDRDFVAVIRACASVPRPDGGTWITPEIVRGYTELHLMGHAHSVEAWDGDALVGGLYGVDAGGAFGGESMFYLQPNASKLALLFLVEHLRGRGLDWVDIQMMTPHMRALGATLLSRDAFLEKLAATRRRGLTLFRATPP